MRHRTAVPQRYYHLLCMLEWSLSGHCSVCINHSAQNFKGWLGKTLNGRHFHLYLYFSYKLHSSFKPAWIFFVDFGSALQVIFLKLMKKMMLVLGPRFRDRKSLETKQTQVKPNANRGWPIKPVDHIWLQLTGLRPNSPWTSTSQNAHGAPPY